MIDPVEFGKQIGGIVREAVAPLLKRIEELEARQPQKGDPGRPGDPGKDAEPVLVADVVAELVKSDLLAPVLDLYVADAVGEYFKANPVQHGKDGQSATDDQVAAVVKDYLTANPPAPGKDGKDGLDLNDVFRADGGHLMAVMSDGTTKDLGKFVGENGRDGKDGRDGLGFEDAELVVDGDHAALRFVRGERVKELRIPLPTMKHIGFWQSGMSAKACETTTHDGSLWLALRDTSEMPSYKSADWQLAARKGRDGVDGKAPPKSGPVNLKGGDDA